MTPRNVRAYRTKGLLAPPIRVGRTSQYRTAHLHRLRDIRKLRDAGLPLKMIIEAAHRGEDLGPEGSLWLAAGRAPLEPAGRVPAPPFVADPEAYAIMQTLTNRGVTPSTVMLLALRTARAGTALAADLTDLLAAEAEETSLEAEQLLLPPSKADIIDLATVITREMLGATLTPAARL